LFPLHQPGEKQKPKNKYKFKKKKKFRREGAMPEQQ
jgi:hypothetical protein